MENKKFSYHMLIIILLTILCGCEPSLRKDKICFMSHGLKLIGDMYIPTKISSTTGIIFLHGSRPEARNLLIYKLLYRKLANRGYIILAFDQRGYGESDDPKEIKSMEDIDFVRDGQEAVSYFKRITSGLGIRSVAIVGHSFGGGVALAAGMKDPGISCVISISPGRRISSRFLDENASDGISWVQWRKSKDMGLEQPIPLELIVPMLNSYNIEKYRDATFAKPVLFVEGEKELVEDLKFSIEYMQTLKGPVEHVLISGADHYFGTKKIKIWRNRICWFIVDSKIVSRLAQIIDNWIISSHKETERNTFDDK